MIEREPNDPSFDFDPDALGLPPEPEDDPEEGVLPGVDLSLGEDEEISGGDDLADQDEENMYGNDALVDDYADLEREGIMSPRREPPNVA